MIIRIYIYTFMLSQRLLRHARLEKNMLYIRKLIAFATFYHRYHKSPLFRIPPTRKSTPVFQKPNPVGLAPSQPSIPSVVLKSPSPNVYAKAAA